MYRDSEAGVVSGFSLWADEMGEERKGGVGDSMLLFIFGTLRNPLFLQAFPPWG